MAHINFNIAPPPRFNAGSPYNTENWLMQNSGPKQSRKVQGNDNATPASIPNPPNFATNNGNGYVATANGAHINENGNQAAPSLPSAENGQSGMSDFLPSLNNTVEREAVSHRKHRLPTGEDEDDLNPKKSKTARGGGAGSGIIGENI
jgi:hypothetical protein